MQANDIAVNLLVFQNMPFYEALDHVVEAQCSIVELAYTAGYAIFDEYEAFTEKSAIKIGALLEQKGLSCRSVAAHMDLGSEDAIERFVARLQFSSQVGASIVITNTSTIDKKKQFVHNLRILSEKAEQLGLIIALENPGDGKNNLFPNGETGALLIKELGLQNVRLNYDFSNSLSYSALQLDSEKDCVCAVPMSANLHLKDMKRWENATGHGWDFCAIGEGDHDYPLLIEIVKKTNKKLPMSLELPLHMQRGPDFLMHKCHKTRNKEYLITAIRQSIDNILKIWGLA